MGILPIFGLKLKFYSGDFDILETHWVLLWYRGSKSNFTLGAFFILRSLPNLNFTPGLLHTLGLAWTFWVSGYQNKIIFLVFLPIVWVPNCNLTLWLLSIFGPNSYFTPGILTILGTSWVLLRFRGQNQMLLWGHFNF
jgi:hypothetical protein